MTQGLSPRAAWRVLREGNERFVSGESIHPSQGIEDRERLVGGQHPHVVLFGCGDSRLAAEIIFDQGLGDMFVVRTAGHVIDSAVLGSLEYGPVELDVPLIVILGHDNCGAISATLSALDDLQLPTGYIRDVVEKVAPSILAGRILMQRSRIISDRVNSGKLAIVGLTYNLDQGKIHVRGVFGDIGEVTIEPM